MGKAKWGGIGTAVAIAAVVIVVLLMRGMSTDDEPADPSPDSGGTTAQSAGSQDSGGTSAQSAGDQDSDGTSVQSAGGQDNGGTSVQSAGDQDNGVGADAGPQRQSTGSGDAVDAVTGAVQGDDPDTTGAAGVESADGRTGESGSSATMDTPQTVAVEESGGKPDEALQAEAETFVRELAESSAESVPADGVEGFMGPGRTLSSILPGDEAADTASPDTGTVDETAVGPDTAAASGAPDAQPENTGSATASVPRPEAADAEGADTVQTRSTTAEAGDSPVTDAPEAGEAGDAREARVDLPLSERVDLPLSEETPVTIAELLGAEDAVASDAVFYVHTVRPDDDLGIWGIVHDGITENFAEGVAVHRGESVETYRVDIPSDADQLDADRSSSFLGKIIYEKSRKTYVYNYRTDRLGRNPDLIMPGQEIVIVSFTPEELIEIYKYFAGDR